MLRLIKPTGVFTAKLMSGIPQNQAVPHTAVTFIALVDDMSDPNPGKKRKVSKSRDDDASNTGRPSKRSKVEDAKPVTIKKNVNQIGNKMKRQEMWQKVKHEQKKAKSKDRKKRQKEAEALGDDVRALYSLMGSVQLRPTLALLTPHSGTQAPPKKAAKTLDNTREKDETIVDRTFHSCP